MSDPLERNDGETWLRTIPADWQVVPAKALFTERREQSRESDVHLTPSQAHGVLPQREYMEKTGSRVVLNLSGSDHMKRVRAGDFVIHLRSFQGGIEYSPLDGKVSMAYTVLAPRTGIVERYFRWVLKPWGYIQELRVTTNQLRDGQSIKFQQFSLVRLPAPPPSVQADIADFLDRETARIDTLIEKQEKLIETLRERRTALVATVLTQGLDGDARFLRSCVDWMTGAKIPAHWPVAKVRYLLKSMKAGDAIDGKDIEPVGEIPVYGGNGLRGFTERFTHDGDLILIGRQGALCGNIHRTSGKIWASEHAIVAIGRPGVDPGWLAYQLGFMNLGQYSRSTAQPGIGVEQVAALDLHLPPKFEQEEIAARLDAETSKIDALIAKAERFIELAKERRSALITAAVTGQIEVGEMAVA